MYNNYIRSDSESKEILADYGGNSMSAAWIVVFGVVGLAGLYQFDRDYSIGDWNHCAGID